MQSRSKTFQPASSELHKIVFAILTALALGIGGWALAKTQDLDVRQGCSERDTRYINGRMDRQDNKLDRIENKLDRLLTADKSRP